jgi:hypothetical protein
VFPIQNGLKGGNILSSEFALENAVGKGQRKSGRTEIQWDTSTSGLY